MMNADAFRRPDGSPGKGASVEIRYNPSQEVVGDGSEEWQHRPPEVGLVLCLRLAADAAEGVMEPGEVTIDGAKVRRCDAAAIGLGPYAGNPGTENALRQEKGLPPRTRY
jgi:hypothetical protein